MTDHVVLASKLDLATVSDLAATLRARTEPETVIDMMAVTHLGALGLQVLLAAAKTANAERREIKIVNTSDRVLNQMRVMGMTPEAIAKGYQ